MEQVMEIKSEGKKVVTLRSKGGCAKCYGRGYIMLTPNVEGMYQPAQKRTIQVPCKCLRAV